MVNTDDLQLHIKKSLEYVKEQKDEKGKKFYENALKILQKPKIIVLKIVDENTIGLDDSHWEALVYKEGTSNKDQPTDGGSFGIGKNAPYAASELSMVCYSTHYVQPHRIEKFIARCRLVAHENPKNEDVELQHVGFGTSEELKKGRYQPVMGDFIPDIFRLPKRGTGIFIFGFKNGRDTDWEKSARCTIASNFFAAIHDKKLEVVVGGAKINNETLNVEDFGDGKEKQYYDLYKNTEEAIRVSGKFGNLNLKIATGNDNMENRVAYINSRGMLITIEKTFKDNPFYARIEIGKYVAVVWAADDATEKKIREMEPPTHKLINYKRVGADDQKRVKKELDELNDKIVLHIKKKLDIDDVDDSGNISELAPIIPFEAESNKDNNDSKGSKKPGTIKVTTSTPTNSITISDSKDSTDGHESGKKSGTGYDKKTRIKIAAKTNMKNIRVTRHDENLRVAFDSITGINKFVLCPAGEENLVESAITVKRITNVDGVNEVALKEGTITVNSDAGKRVILDIPLDDSLQYTGYSITEYRTRRKSV